MKLSRKNFVEFLEIRLTPKAARSYLDYVEAFQRAIKQKDDFLFNGKSDTKEYLIKFLNKEVHPPAFRKLYKESSRSNIRVGIRTLLLYYQYEEEKAIRKAQNRSKFFFLVSEPLQKKLTASLFSPRRGNSQESRPPCRPAGRDRISCAPEYSRSCLFSGFPLWRKRLPSHRRTPHSALRVFCSWV